MEFQRKAYDVTSEKLTEDLKLIFLSDLHSTQYGPDNEELVSRIATENPDLILCGGDMVIARERGNFRTAMILLLKLRKLAPVAIANGNHESEMRKYEDRYQKWQELFKKADIESVNNANQLFTVRGQKIRVYGLEIPLSRYRKLRKPHMTLSEIEELAGASPVEDLEEYTILLAHNPEFMDLYLRWGADLTLCGHFHGGVMRIGKTGTLISPYGFPFPKYGYGRYSRYGHTGIVTSGLGDHVMKLRIHNPKEYVVINLKRRIVFP